MGASWEAEVRRPWAGVRSAASPSHQEAEPNRGASRRALGIKEAGLKGLSKQPARHRETQRA